MTVCYSGHGKLTRGGGKIHQKISKLGTSLVVWQLRLYASTAGGSGSIPVQGTKIPHATCHSQGKKENFFFLARNMLKNNICIVSKYSSTRD